LSILEIIEGKHPTQADFFDDTDSLIASESSFSLLEINYVRLITLFLISLKLNEFVQNLDC
jgi:hypothetical protein